MNEVRPGGSDVLMQHAKVMVQWQEGLHLRRAAQLVKVAQRFHSTLYLKCGGKIADLRSIMSVLALCATMGTMLELEASGDDETEASQTVEQVFEAEA